MSLILIAADLVAMAVLIFGMFVPRHQRRDLIVAYLVVNIGVLALMATLSSVSTSIGVGLGLFGVLSIIRLRSEELAQHEVAYYFAALTLGLLAGSTALDVVWTLGLMAAVLVALFIGDHSLVAKRTSKRQITLDRAYADEAELRARVAELVGGQVQSVTVLKTDLVNDTTVVDVRYSALPAARVHEAIR
ncbi:MAG: DUF4956 domain-containing protein [Propionibacteriaceae bacterium]|nr:DUF4956 domain-containing protein [Propionibacteriaceae bacterium]